MLDRLDQFARLAGRILHYHAHDHPFQVGPDGEPEEEKLEQGRHHEQAQQLLVAAELPQLLDDDTDQPAQVHSSPRLSRWRAATMARVTMPVLRPISQSACGQRMLHPVPFRNNARVAMM